MGPFQPLPGVRQAKLALVSRSIVTRSEPRHPRKECPFLPPTSVVRRERAIRLTVAASVGAKAFSMLCTFAQVPVALHYLGTEAYGLWITLLSIVLVLSSVDFGLGVGMQHAMARAFWKRRHGVDEAHVLDGGRGPPGPGARGAPCRDPHCTLRRVAGHPSDQRARPSGRRGKRPFACHRGLCRGPAAQRRDAARGCAPARLDERGVDRLRQRPLAWPGRVRRPGTGASCGF